MKADAFASTLTKPHELMLKPNHCQRASKADQPQEIGNYRSTMVYRI